VFPRGLQPWLKFTPSFRRNSWQRKSALTCALPCPQIVWITVGWDLGAFSVSSMGLPHVVDVRRPMPPSTPLHLTVTVTPEITVGAPTRSRRAKCTSMLTSESTSTAWQGVEVTGISQHATGECCHTHHYPCTFEQFECAWVINWSPINSRFLEETWKS
jgi:hypothetical protein